MLWYTRDGGKQWFAVATKSLGIKFDVLAVDAFKGQVYVIGWKSDDKLGLWRCIDLETPRGNASSRPRSIRRREGPLWSGALVFKGANGWLMVGNDRGVTGSARLSPSGAWVKWSAPCDKVGGGYDVPVANSPTTLVDVCSIGGFGEVVGAGHTSITPRSVQNWLFSSSDSGPDVRPRESICSGENTTQWLDGRSRSPGVPFTGSDLCRQKRTRRDRPQPEHLIVTRNDGKTWTSVYAPQSPSRDLIESIAFASRLLGFGIVYGGSSSSSLVYMSSNGGRTWHQTDTSTR